MIRKIHHQGCHLIMVNHMNSTSVFDFIHSEFPSDDSSIDTLLPNQYIGNPLPPKQSDTIRISFQNLNGLHLDQTGGDFSTICQDIKITHTDVALFAEPNICHKHYHVKENLYETATQHALSLSLIHI